MYVRIYSRVQQHQQQQQLLPWRGCVSPRLSRRRAEEVVNRRRYVSFSGGFSSLSLSLSTPVIYNNCCLGSCSRIFTKTHPLRGYAQPVRPKRVPKVSAVYLFIYFFCHGPLPSPARTETKNLGETTVVVEK